MSRLSIPIGYEQTVLVFESKVVEMKIPSELFAAALELISRLQKALQGQSNEQQLYNLYMHDFPKALKQHPGKWPLVFEVEGEYENANFGARVTVFYEEVVLSHNATQNTGVGQSELGERSKDAYEELMESKVHEARLPFPVLWSIFQRFLRTYALGIAGYFTLEQATSLLTSASRTANKDFSFFATVALTCLYTRSGHHSSCLQVIQTLSLQDLAGAPKGLNAYLQLLHNAVLAYFETSQYQRGARLAAAAIVFFRKNNKYLLHHSQSKLQHLQTLLLFNSLFLEEKYNAPTASLASLYGKLNQRDLPTFQTHYKLISNANIAQANNKFLELEAISLNTILENYTQISVKRVSELLSVSQDQVKHRLQARTQLQNNTWDKTVIAPLLNCTRKITIEDQIIKLDVEQEQIVWNNQEITELTHKLTSLPTKYID